MIGLRTGIKAGARIGGAVGLGADPIAPNATNPMAGVTKDATSNIYVPANGTEWGTVHTALGFGSAPVLAWGCQDASGGAAAIVGSINLDPEAPGTRIDYQQAVSGWTRKAILSRGDAILTSNAGLPDPATTSMMIMGYLVIEAPGSSNDRITLGNTNRALLQVTTDPAIRVVNSTNVQNGAAVIDGAVHPFILQFDQTANTVTCFSDQEYVTVAKLVDPNKEISFVGAPAGSGKTYILYGALWSGAAAELTRTQVKALETILGWSPSWSP